MRISLEAGSIELVVLGLVAALVVVLAVPLFEPNEAVDKQTVAEQKID